MNIDELRERNESLRSEMLAMYDEAMSRRGKEDKPENLRAMFKKDEEGNQVENEFGGFTEEEAKHARSILEEIEENKSWISRLGDFTDDEIESYNNRSEDDFSNEEVGDDDKPVERTRGRRSKNLTSISAGGRGGLQHKKTPDPFDLSKAMAFDVNAGNLRSQVETALEKIDPREESYRSIVKNLDQHEFDERANLQNLRSVVIYGSPDYKTGFRKGLAGREYSYTDAERAIMDVAHMFNERALGLTSGYTLPITIDPTWVYTADVEINPMRRVARVQSTVTNSFFINTAGAVTASWDADATEVSDDTPTVGTVEIKCSTPRVFAEYTIQSEQDVASLESNLLRLMVEGQANLEASGFMTGNGTLPNPQGLIPGLEAYDSNTPLQTLASQTAITEAELKVMLGGLPNRWKPRARWGADDVTYFQVMSLESSAGARVWEPSMKEGVPDRLYGKPAEEFSTMPINTVAGNTTLVYGSFEDTYCIVDRLGMSVERVQNLMGANGRPTGKRGILGYWRVGAGVFNGAAMVRAEVPV